MSAPPEWWPHWQSSIIVIVASGPSAASIDLALGRDRARFIVINNSWLLAPWADLLFAADFKWWAESDGCPAFKGLKVSTEARAAASNWSVHRLGVRRIDALYREPRGVVGGNSSGFQAFNLAFQLQPRRIILVGYDMSLKDGVHWHGRHPPRLGNPSPSKAASWRRAMQAAAPVALAAGIEVINCSPLSALTAYPKLTFDEALALP